jgi:hypothetical protein
MMSYRYSPARLMLAVGHDDATILVFSREEQLHFSSPTSFLCRHLCIMSDASIGIGASCAVSETETSNVEVISFAVQILVSDIALDFDNSSNSVKAPPYSPSALSLEKGIVGTIIIMNRKSVMIWFGWGTLATTSPETQHNVAGNASNVNMGPLFVGMPRTKYQGAFSGESEGSASKLIGSESDDEETMARNMASRLSLKLGSPVMLSCSFEGCPATSDEGIESGIIQHRAAAQAERKILQMLSEKLNK